MIARIRRLALAGLILTVAAVVAPSARAQQTASTPGVAAQDHAAPAGPTLDRAAVGARSQMRQPATLDAAEAAMQSRLGLGQARALMIVGFAAVVIGLLMDNDPGTLIAIGGAVVGLYGLYHYLR